MKIIILLISSILTMTITHAEESPRARNFGEIMGRLMYNSFKGVTLGITDEAAKDIQKITHEPIAEIIVDGKKKMYKNGRLFHVEEVKK